MFVLLVLVAKGAIRMNHLRGHAVVVLLLCAGPAFGQAEKSLDKCQKEAAGQTAKFVSAQLKTMANCLQKISGKVIKSGAVVADAAKTCTGAFRKLENTDDSTKELESKAIAKIKKKCDPTFNTSLAHSTNDVLGPGAGVAESVEATNLNSWCTNFDGDGTIGSVAEWIDCQVSASKCHARQQILLEYPRVLEWATAVKPAIIALGADQKYTDAANAVQDLIDAIDKFANNQHTIRCGPAILSCGNAVKDGTDDCDGADLGGATCGSVGFFTGTLACGADCHFDVSGCVTGAFPATGQTFNDGTADYEVGDDGDLENGAAHSYVDNGDGTITDANTGLMWEKKDRAGGIHDIATTYTWDVLDTAFIAVLNTPPCFATYCDWRVPNYHELSSIVDFGADAPSIDVAFNNNCSGSCSFATCSCTKSGTLSPPFWTSTTVANSTAQAWVVQFDEGRIVQDVKSVSSRRVRAVRGGL